MATKTSGWLCNHKVTVDNSNAAYAKVTVECIWQNSGWEYDINYVSAWVYCGDQSYKVKDSGSIKANSSSTQAVSCGSYTFTVNKTSANQSISCYAKITSNSSYVSGTKTSTATKASVTAKASYTITYNANGGSGAPSTQTKSNGTSIKLSTNTPTRAGYTFKGWGTSASATTVSYSPGASYTANASITLYAIWTANKYTITYNANGGSGAPSAQEKTYGVALTLSTTKPTRTNYTFEGWGTSASSTTVSYASGASYTANASITLYAVWKLAYTKPRVSNVSINRCNITDNTVAISDEGSNFVLYFDWATDITNPTYTVEWKSNDDPWTKATKITTNLSGTSGTSVSFKTNGRFLNTISTEKTYNVRLTVTDSSGSTEIYIDVPSLMMAFDVYPAVVSYLHMENTETSGGDANNRIYYNTTGNNSFSHEQNKTYGLKFIARSKTEGTVLVSNIGGSSSNLNTYTLTTDWLEYTHSYVSGKTGSLTFWLQDPASECDIKSVELQTVTGTGILSLLASDAGHNKSYWTKTGLKLFDVLTENNGLGVAIGKTAETAKLFDVALSSRLRNNVCIGNKTGYLDGNSGVYINRAGYMHLQRDPANGHPYIGFLTDEGEGAAMSAFIRFNKERSQMEYLNAPAHRFSQEIYISGDKSAHNDGKTGWYIGSDGTAHTNATTPGIYFHKGTSTAYTSSIRENTSGTLTISDKLLIEGSNNVLWSGSWYMRADQVATLSEPISNQTNGILLVFSRYSDGTAQNYHFSTHFVSKRQINKHAGCGHSFMLTTDGTMSAFATKYLYIHDTQIVGNDVNDDAATTGACGIKYTNNGFVLRYVYGV